MTFTGLKSSAMEWDKDEALRSREIAEKKFLAKDIVGAKKLALKAKNLYPDLDGISQMIATLDVHLSADTTVNGERDWYAVLSVNAKSDEEIIRKQYRKLALMFHPDKNKCIGAEGAFKLISDAWSVLSDGRRRMAYDNKRNNNPTRQRYSWPHSSNGLYKFTDNASVGLYNFTNYAGVTGRKNTAQNRTVPAAVPNPNGPSESKTFWTSCKNCEMQYEYLRIYLNHNLLCLYCHKPFLAVETGTPAHRSHTSTPHPYGYQQQNSNHNGSSHDHTKNASVAPENGSAFQHRANLDAFSNSYFRWGAFSRTAGAASATASSIAAAHAANKVHQAYEKVRKEREEKQEAAKRGEFVQKKNYVSNDSGGIEYHNKFDRKHRQTFKAKNPAKRRRSINEDFLNYNGSNRSMTNERKTNFANGNKKLSGTALSDLEMANGGFRDDKNRMMHWEITHLDIHHMLIQKAKISIQKKLEYLTMIHASKLADKQKTKSQQKEKDNSRAGKTVVQGSVSEVNKMGEPNNSISQVSRKNASSDCVNRDREDGEKYLEIDVPDPDFHDFDIHRSESSFECDQVWAIYDNEDVMPRFYVLIQNVLSMEPFKVRASYLNTNNNHEFDSLNWVGMGFPKTSGDFKVGGHRVINSLNMFSHRVRCDKVTCEIIRVVPRKGEVWALYSNWSTDWNENTPDDVIYKYDMVEVLDDYNDKQGASVSPLVKVAGFRTVFQRHTDPKQVKSIPRKEMFRFSHQVPSYFLTGDEASNAPKDCLELDPAAIPSELQILSVAEEE